MTTWCSTVWCIVTLTLSLLAGRLAADAQQAGKVPRIGYLRVTSPSDRPPLLDAFRQRLRELVGEGQNIVIDYRYAEGRFDRLPDLAAELVRSRWTSSYRRGRPSDAVKNATETIPIVMIGVRDPVGAGLIASLARPGGNVTGVSGYAGWKPSPNNWSCSRRPSPRSAGGHLSNPTNAYHQLAIREVNVAARSLGVQLYDLTPGGFRGPDNFDGAFAAMAKERVEALLVLSDSIFNSHRTRLADLAARSRLPAAYGVRESVEAEEYHVLRAELSRFLPAQRRVRGQNPEGRKAHRPCRGAGFE